MSEAINIGLDSNAAEIGAKLDAFPAEMANAIAATLDHENELTIGQIQTRKLSRRGPTTLGVISNRLRLSIRRTDAIVQGMVIDSAIGSNVKYMGVHEFGFHETVLVREHRARHHALDVFSVRGKIIPGWQMTDLGTGKHGKSRIAEGFVTVRAHHMTMNIPARAPIRTTIAERSADYRAAISNAIINAWGGAN